MSKAWKITIIIVSSILVLFIGFVSVYYLWPWNKKFFDIASQEFEIPGLDTKFVPQGLSKVDGQDKYLISGYMSDESSSRVYLLDNSGKTEKYFTLSQTNTDYKGHAGGILSKGSTIWIVGDGSCHRFMLSDVNKVENGGVVDIIDSFNTLNGGDFIFEYNNYLWIGEFYKENKHETAKSHHLKVRSGETNPSLVFGFKIDESMSCGLYSKSPEKALSIRGKCQGMDVTSSGNFVMSCSYNVSDSNIYYYKNVLNEERHDTYYLGNHVLDLWYLDNNSLLYDLNTPSMSEEIIINNDRVYILFESACKKYKIFNRKQLKNVYSIPLNALEN